MSLTFETLKANRLYLLRRESVVSVEQTGLLIADLQNDFLDPKGAYGRAGHTAPEISAFPGRLSPLTEQTRARGCWIISTQFTLVPAKGGEPMISPPLKSLTPFLAKGDFAPGNWGHCLVDVLSPADISIKKIAYSAFLMTRLEWMLRKCNIQRLLVCGIVTNGGVTSTIREAHVRDFDVTVLSDGCAVFSHGVHETAINAPRSVCRVATIAETSAELASQNLA